MEIDHDLAERRVRGPALGLMITGIVGAALEGASILWSALWAGSAPFAHRGEEAWFVFATGVYGAVWSGIGVFVGAFLVWGALKMMKLESYTLVLIACILAVVPCLSPCCLLTTPFGIWGLIVINDPTVRPAFRSQA